MKNTITLLDGYALIYRSYFAFIKNPLINKQGQNVSVVYGFFNTLSYFLAQKKRFAVVFDSKTPTFRHELYSEYKANREKAPDDLRSQIPLVEKILNLLEVPILQQDGVEADDIIATIARRSSEQQIYCEIITGDKDLLQLVDDYVSVIKPDKGEYITLTEKEVVEKWGVKPNQILDFLSIIGDKADNVPGIMGIGEKGALKMLLEFSTLDSIYENIPSFTASVQKKLEDSKENAFLSRQLITLKTDLAFTPENIPTNEVNWSLASPLFIELGVPSLAKKGGASAKSLSPAPPTSPAPVDTDKAIEGPGGIWIPQEKSPWGPALQEKEWVALTTTEEVQKELQAAAKEKLVAFDCETTSLNPLQCQLVGFSFCYNAQKAFYVPIIAENQDILSLEAIRPILNTFFATPGLQIIGQNFKYDYKALRHCKITPTHVYADTLVAAWLIDSDLSNYNMDFLASRYLNYTTIKYSDIVPKKESFAVVPLETAAAYAAEDALITFRLWKILEPLLEKGSLKDLFFNIEMEVAAILAEMECEGILLNCDFLGFFSKKLELQLAKIQEEIYELVGHEFNINSPKQLQEVLFGELKLPPGKKTKTGYSTDTSVLQFLAGKHPVPSLILRQRTLSKLKSTYADALPELINPDTNRIHTNFIQTGTATGRLSSREPNLQNIPIKEEEGRNIRKAFVAPEGKIFLSADYSQIELAVLASLSKDKNLSEAFITGKDIHRHTASLIFDKEDIEITASERRIAKTINFGVIYGMSAFRLSQELEIPMGRAKQFIDAYFATYSGIRQFITQTVEETKEKGYVTTQAGHIRRISEINNRNMTVQAAASRVAVNTPIQGTAADIVKRAMIAIAKRLKESTLEAKLLLQIHDELLFELPESEESVLRKIVEEEMKKATLLSVPVTISIETGKSWGDFH